MTTLRLTIFGTLAALAVIIVLVFGFDIRPHAEPVGNAKTVEIESTAITNFQIGLGNKTRFGRLRYAGGIEFSASGKNPGGISGIRILDGGGRFLAISDNGGWFSGDIQRDGSGKITAIANARMSTLLDTSGAPIITKHRGDAEGLEIVGDQVLVSFERKSRIYKYKLDLENLSPTAKSFRPLISNYELEYNRGLEAITILERTGSDDISSLRIAVFSEYSLDDEGNIRGFFSAGKKWDEFSVKAIDAFKITDATLLPGGDILLLERQFSIVTGPIIQIRKIAVEDIRAGVLIDGEVIFEANSLYQIDNLEGISVWQDAEARTMITLVSDNNFSFLQRNLMLEFELMSTEN